MSSIFNLLDGIAEPDRGRMMKSIARSNTSHELKANSLTTMGKPKGLTIRSISDMNVSKNKHSSSGVKKNAVMRKDQNSLKLKSTQLDNSGRPISPGREILAMKPAVQASKLKETVGKAETAMDSCKKTPKISEESVFKKPLLPKKSRRKFPEPESLAHYYDDQYHFDYGYMEKEFNDLRPKGKENVMPYVEEELVLDSEMLIPAEIPKFLLRSFDEDSAELSSPELPEISDDENFW